MALKENINFNPALPESATNQRFIFETPQVINQQTGQLSSGEYTVPNINSTTLQPATPINYNTPTYPSATLPPAVDSTKVETPQTDAVSKMIADLQSTSGLAGEMAGYKSEQEKAANLEAMRKTEADYTYQYKQLENEWKNLQIEAQKVPEQMQLQAEGRGITAGGLAPLTASEQRKITLKSLDVSARANTVNALLLGTQGLIDSALKAVDRAVNDKFAVREANRKTQLENLDLLLKDPKIDAETKAKAAEVAAKVKAETEADAKKKEDSKTIMNWAVDIAGKVAADKTIPPQLANQIMDIARSENPDMQKAFGLYSPYSVKEVKAPTVIGSADTGYYQWDENTKSWKPTGLGGGKGGLTPTQQKALSDYIGQVSTYKSREEALTDLGKYQTKMLVDVGTDGLAIIQAEIDRLFPPPPITPPPTEEKFPWLKKPAKSPLKGVTLPKTTPTPLAGLGMEGFTIPSEATSTGFWFDLFK